MSRRRSTGFPISSSICFSRERSGGRSAGRFRKRLKGSAVISTPSQARSIQLLLFPKARHDHFDELLDVLVDMFLNSTFDPGEITKEREVIKEELAMYLDQPQQYVQELLNATLWPGQPLGRSITGTKKSLDAMSRSHIVEFQKGHYTAAGTVIAAAGHLEHRQVVRAVEGYAGKFRRGPRQTVSCLPPRRNPNRAFAFAHKEDGTNANRFWRSRLLAAS